MKNTKKRKRSSWALFLSQYLYSEALLSLQHNSPNDIIMMEIIPKTLSANGGEIMRTGMKKKDKVTEIYFNEADSIMYGRTYNTKLKKQLRQLNEDYPNQCKIIEEPECGMIEFEINKERLTFKINPVISEKRRKELSDQAKKNNNLLRKDIS